MAVGAGAVLAAVRLLRRERPRYVLTGFLAVAVAAAVAAYTGRPENYFLPSILSNAAAALAWTVSIVLRWPLLGVVLGVVTRTRGRWRRDPDLLRAYSRASWLFSAQYVTRLAVEVPLYLVGFLPGLAVARFALGWPLVLVLLSAAWLVIRRTLPPDHPGIRHPREPEPASSPRSA